MLYVYFLLAVFIVVHTETLTRPLGYRAVHHENPCVRIYFVVDGDEGGGKVCFLFLTNEDAIATDRPTKARYTPMTGVMGERPFRLYTRVRARRKRFGGICNRRTNGHVVHTHTFSSTFSFQYKLTFLFPQHFKGRPRLYTHTHTHIYIYSCILVFNVCLPVRYYSCSCIRIRSPPVSASLI